MELDDNNLTGTIPAEIGNLTKLTILRLDNTKLTGPIPAEIGNLAELKLLDLQNSNLTGPIPAEIGQVGKNRANNSITTVNLSGNIWLCYNTSRPTRIGSKLTITGWPSKKCPEILTPSAPTLVADDTKLLVFWSRNSFYSTNKYDIQYLKKGEKTWTSHTYTGTDTTTTITDLDNTATYLVRVRNTDTNLGNSDWSLPTTISMANSTDGCPFRP